MKKIIVTIGLFISSSIMADPAYLLFGGNNHEKFLGCLNCNSFDSNSVWNEFGKYGSEFYSDSIWNEFGIYGSEFSSESPWNEFSTNGPIIVDNSGNYYGKFTINEFDNQTRLEFPLWILKNYEYVRENLNEIRQKL
ncbi:hypothetical protein [Avibacterium avium]|uniref:hypothetical protein n=1 Tax=Avibacterium avium TaxID=751 RepID=UPI003BF8B0C4